MIQSYILWPQATLTTALVKSNVIGYNFLWSELKQGLIVASRHATSHDLQYMFMVMLPVTTQAGIKLQDFRQTLFHL